MLLILDMFDGVCWVLGGFALFVDANLQDMRLVKLMDVAKYANIQGATHVRNPNNQTLRSIFTVHHIYI